MSRAVSMIVWLLFASAHLGIVLYISPLMLQLLLMGSVEGLIGVLTWVMHRKVERRGADHTLNEVDRRRRAHANRRTNLSTNEQYQGEFPPRHGSLLK